MNTYTIYFIRINMIPANKQVEAESEEKALLKFKSETIHGNILYIEKL